MDSYLVFISKTLTSIRIVPVLYVHRMNNWTNKLVLCTSSLSPNPMKSDHDRAIVFRAEILPSEAEILIHQPLIDRQSLHQRTSVLRRLQGTRKMRRSTRAQTRVYRTEPRLRLNHTVRKTCGELLPWRRAREAVSVGVRENLLVLSKRIRWRWRCFGAVLLPQRDRIVTEAPANVHRIQRFITSKLRSGRFPQFTAEEELETHEGARSGYLMK